MSLVKARSTARVEKSGQAIQEERLQVFILTFAFAR